MNNEMFKHLLEQLRKVYNSPDYPKGRGTEGTQENEIDAKFSKLFQSLDAVVDTVRENQNLTDRNEYSRNSEEIDLAFDNFKSACNDFLSLDTEGMPSEMRDALISINSVQFPLDTIISDLGKGQTLNEALSDPSWLSGIFTDDEPVKDREDYVPGQYSIDNMSYKEILDQYKADHDDIGLKYQAHIKKISGSNENPTNTIISKISLIQDFANSFPGNEKKIDLQLLIGDGYREMEKRMNRKNITSVRYTDMIMSNAFFGFEADKLYERTQVLGEIDAMKALPPQVSKLIKDETNKLRFKTAKLGVSNEQLERLEKLSFPIQIISTHVELLRTNVKGLDEGYTADVMKEIDSLVSNIQGYIADKPGAHCPTDKEWIHLAKSVKDVLFDTDMLYMDGSLYKIYEGMAGIYKYLYESVPSIRKSIEKDYKAVQDDIANGYLDIAEKLKDPELDEKKRFNMEQAIKNIYSEKLVDRELMYEAMYIRMARDPEYNREVLDDCKKALEELDAVKEKKPGSTSVYPFQLENFITGEKHTPEEIYNEVYTTLVVGQKIAIEREKFDLRHNPEKHLTSVEKLKNSVHPGLEKIMSAKTSDSKLLNYMKSVVTGLKKSEIFNEVQKLPADKVLKLAVNPDLSEKLGKAFENHEKDLLRGVNDKTFAALTQESGAFYWPNSDSYKKMSDNIKSIFQKKTMGEGVKMEDYKNLYKSLEEYSMSHDSHPTLDNGKLRANSVINMMSVLGNNLAKADPSLKEKIRADRMVNMTRSKAYRDAIYKDASNKLKEIVSRNKEQIQTDYNGLPKDVKESISECLGMVALSSELDKEFANDPGCEFRGKINDPNVEGRMQGRLYAATKSAQAIKGAFDKNPVSALKILDSDLMKIAVDVSNQTLSKNRVYL